VNPASRAVPFLALTACLAIAHAAEPPTDWIEPATGHRVIRISREPGSSSLYFHQNAYTTEGDKMIIMTPSGISAVNLTNWQLEPVASRARYSMSGSSGIEVGRKTRQVYWSMRDTNGAVKIVATHLDTKVTRDVGTLPFTASFGGVNADETFLVGAYNLSGGPRLFDPPGANPRTNNTARARQLRPTGPRSMALFALDTRTGKVQTFHHSTNWLNHVQCSPADPALAMFCHEGDWHNVDRVWTIRIGAEDARLMHARTMQYEIAGHEFFSHDGKWVWYDLQTPRAEKFWLAGVNIASGERIRYPVERRQWSVHYNVSWDGKLFAGDGGGPNSVANQTPLPEKRRLDPPGNGQWIYLFRPKPGEFTNIKVGNETVKVGAVDAEKLVDLSHHDYALEPNVTFTPDGKWIVFRSNMHGARHVYAVEIAKAK